MPRQDFSRHYPRRGQWVVTTLELDLEREGEERQLPRGRLGIATKPRRGEARDPERVWVDFVDEATGFETILRVHVPLELLIPVVARDRIPKPRRETMLPSWQPSA